MEFSWIHFTIVIFAVLVGIGVKYFIHDPAMDLIVEKVAEYVDLINFSSGVGYPTGVNAIAALYDPSGGSVVNGTLGNVGVYTTSSTIVNALRVVTNDSTSFSGTFSLYGIKY